MATTCRRCENLDIAVECSDCSVKGRSDPVPLCSECNDLLHVGFMKDHAVETLDAKRKRSDFKQSLEAFQGVKPVVSSRLVQVGKAKKDVEMRLQNNLYNIQQSFLLVGKVFKQKEQEFLNQLRCDATIRMQLLDEWNTKLSEHRKDLEIMLKEGEELHRASPTQFLEGLQEVSSKIKTVIEKNLEGTSPSINAAVTLDASHIADQVKKLQLKSGGDMRSAPTFTKEIVPMTPPSEGDTLKVYVEGRIDTKGCFWLCPDFNESIANVLDDLSFEIRKSVILDGLKQLEVEDGMECVAEFQEDCRWYRARVEKVESNKKIAHVRWLDFAHMNEVPICNIQALKDDLKDIPYQAMECALFEEGSELTRDARWEFTDLTGNNCLQCTVKRKITREEQSEPFYIVDLQVPDQDTTINDKIKQKLKDAKRGKGSIGCRDVRLLSKEEGGIKELTNEKIEVYTGVENRKSKDKTKEKSKDAKRTDTKAEETTKTEKVNELTESKEVPGKGEEKKEEGQGKDLPNGEQETKSEDAKAEIPQEAQNGTSVDEKVAETKDSESDAKVDAQKETEIAEEKQGETSNASVTETILQNGPVETPQQPAQQQYWNQDASQERQPSGPGAENFQKHPLAGGHAHVKREPQAPQSIPEFGETEGHVESLADMLKRQQQQQGGVLNFMPGPGSNNVNSFNTMGGSLFMTPNMGMVNPGLMQLYGNRHNLYNQRYPQYTTSTYPGPGGPPYMSSEKPLEGSDMFHVVVGDSFNVRVSSGLVEDGSFWALKIRGPELEARFRHLMQEISMQTDSLMPGDIHPGKLTCALYSTLNQWCRAQVLNVTESKVFVWYCDFGTTETISPSEVRVLDVRHLLFPFQAVQYSISNTAYNLFPKEAQETFRLVTADKILRARVDCLTGPKIQVSLIFRNEKQEEIDVLQELIRQGLSPSTGPAPQKLLDVAPVPGAAPATAPATAPAPTQAPGAYPTTQQQSRSQDVRDVRSSSGGSRGNQDMNQAGGQSRCYNCGDMWHHKSQCPYPPKGQWGARQKGGRSQRPKGRYN